MTDRRELYREVSRDDEGIHFSLKWANTMLREWFKTHDEAALIVSEPRRTLDQNSKMWPMLDDIAEQVQWHGEWLKNYEWKDLFTAALRGTRAVPGIEGGVVLLGLHTRRFTISEMRNLIEYMYWFGAEHEVVWSEPARKVIEKYRNGRKAA